MEQIWATKYVEQIDFVVRIWEVTADRWPLLLLFVFFGSVQVYGSDESGPTEEIEDI